MRKSIMGVGKKKRGGAKTTADIARPHRSSKAVLCNLHIVRTPSVCAALFSAALDFTVPSPLVSSTLLQVPPSIIINSICIAGQSLNGQYQGTTLLLPMGGKKRDELGTSSTTSTRNRLKRIVLPPLPLSRLAFPQRRKCRGKGGAAPVHLTFHGAEGTRDVSQCV